MLKQRAPFRTLKWTPGCRTPATLCRPTQKRSPHPSRALAERAAIALFASMSLFSQSACSSSVQGLSSKRSTYRLSPIDFFVTSCADTTTPPSSTPRSSARSPQRTSRTSPRSPFNSPTLHPLAPLSQPVLFLQIAPIALIAFGCVISIFAMTGIIGGCCEYRTCPHRLFYLARRSLFTSPPPPPPLLRRANTHHLHFVLVNCRHLPTWRIPPSAPHPPPFPPPPTHTPPLDFLPLAGWQLRYR